MFHTLRTIFFVLIIYSASIVASDVEHKEPSDSKKSICASPTSALMPTAIDSTPVALYTLWKIFDLRSGNNLEFIDDNRLVSVCGCQKAIVIDVNTGSLGTLTQKEQNLYTDDARPALTKSRVFSVQWPLFVEVHHLPTSSKMRIFLEKLDIKHCLPRTVALSPNKHILALGDPEKARLYTASPHLLKNRLETQTIVGKQPDHAKWCISEEFRGE